MPVSLKKPEQGDMEYIRQLWADPLTMAEVGGPVILSRDQARQWFERVVDPGSTNSCYRLILDPAGNPVGEVSFHRLDPTTMSASLNIKVAHSERGRGYALDALRTFTRLFFESRGGQVLIDDVAPDNRLGQQFLLHFGFTRDNSTEEVCRLCLTRDRYTDIYTGQ